MRGLDLLGFNPLSTGAESRTQERERQRSRGLLVSIPSAPGRSRAPCYGPTCPDYWDLAFQSPQHRGGVAHKLVLAADIIITPRVSIPSAPGRSRALSGDPPVLASCKTVFQSPQHRGGVAHMTRRCLPVITRAIVSIPSAPGRSRARATSARSRLLRCAGRFNPLSTGAESRGTPNERLISRKS